MRRVEPFARGLAWFGAGRTVALVKAAAAVIPALVAYERVPSPRVWRAISWVGAVGLVLYGGANVVVSGAVLAGLVDADGDMTRPR